MPCQNNPEGDTIYAIDNLGISIPCKNRGDGQYICDSILYGKLPVYDSDLCGFKLCDIDVSTGNPIEDVAKYKPSTVFPYYIDGTNCELTDSRKNDGIAKLDCCSVEFTECSMNGNTIDNRYRLSPDFNPEKSINRFTCSGQGCINIPNDYDEKNPDKMKSKYPNVYSNIENTTNKYGIGIFYGNTCNCIKNNTACKNVGNCEPVMGCGICGSAPGDYSCVYSIDPNNPDNRGVPSCKNTPGKGVFNSMQDCVNNCSNLSRYSCVNGNCVGDSNGNYFSLDSCQGTCGKSKVNSLGKINIFLIVSIVVMIFIMFLILLVIINRARGN